MNVGRMERIWWLERGFGKMSKRPKPFEYKGKKKTRLPRESLWRDGLSFSKWWCRGVSYRHPGSPFRRGAGWSVRPLQRLSGRYRRGTRKGCGRYPRQTARTAQGAAGGKGRGARYRPRYNPPALRYLIPPSQPCPVGPTSALRRPGRGTLRPGGGAGGRVARGMVTTLF